MRISEIDGATQFEHGPISCAQIRPVNHWNRWRNSIGTRDGAAQFEQSGNRCNIPEGTFATAIKTKLRKKQQTQE